MGFSTPSIDMTGIQSAISTVTMKNAMNQDAKTVMGLLDGMQEMTEEIQEIQNNANGQGTRAVNLDVRV